MAEQRPFLIFVFLTACYVSLASANIHLLLWYDELFTYYIARQPTVEQMLQANFRIDLNPPLIYFLTRGMHALFGAGEAATRLPAAIGYWIGSAGIFLFLGKRAGYLTAACALALLWSSSLFAYATEARPYGILLGFFGTALVCWDAAVNGKHRGWALAGLAASTTGMMLSHIFAPVSIFPFCLAEAARWGNRKKSDWPVWAALVLPVGLVLVYIPWMRQFQTIAFPPAYQASFVKIPIFFARAFLSVIWPFTIAALLALLIALRSIRRHSTYRFTVADLGLGLGAFAAPVIVNLLLMGSHGSFFPRYALIAGAAFYALLALAVIYFARRSSLAALVFLLVVLMSALWRGNAFTGQVLAATAPNPALNALKPELPLVAASGLTFLEMNHYESRELVARLHLLLDRDSAMRYAHATLFEGYAGLLPYFPIRGTVAQFRDFAAQHRHFLVIGTADYPEDWLLPKLYAEHANVKLLGRYKLPYKDKAVYEVTLP